MKRVDIRVTGLVQGVGFRYSTQQAAERLGVCGTVRNEPDGAVFIEAEAAPDVIEQFIAWCHQGPSYSKVSGVQVEDGETAGFSGFSITG